jgi:DNA invertase Pin-like site-specific DNA recombinase
MTESLRVIGYVRVSTSSPVDDGLGLDVQREAITAWVTQQGHSLTEIVTDGGLSGTLAVQDRPGLCGALQAVRDGAVDAVVVHRLDRLARLLAVQEATLAAFWAAEGRVFEVLGGEVLRDDPEDPMRTALRQMLGVFGQLERATVVARMRAGRRLKGERGGYSGGGPPYGWAASAGELVVAEAEQAALHRLFELRESGLSLRAAGKVLLQEGHRPKRAGVWHPETLRQLELRALAKAATRSVRSS